MMRVLHLIDQASSEACPTTLSLLQLTVSRVGAIEHRVVALGGESMTQGCDAAGLRAERIATPYGAALPGWPAIWRRVRGERFDFVHAWSPASLRLARAMMPGTRRLLTLTQPVPEPVAHSLVRALRHRRRPLHAIFTLSARRRDALLAAGAEGTRVRALPPAVDPSLLETHRREALRASWGVSPTARVIALLSDPPAAGDALQADLGFGLAYATVASALREPPEALLLRHPQQHHRAQSRKMMDNYGVGHIVGQEPRLAAPWQVLPGCDAALCLGDRGGGLALRWAMAAGLPIVAETHPVQDEWLVPDETALFFDRGQAKRLAHRLHQVLLAGPHAAAIGTAAGYAARKQAAPDDYAAAVRDAYNQVA